MTAMFGGRSVRAATLSAATAVFIAGATGACAGSAGGPAPAVATVSLNPGLRDDRGAAKLQAALAKGNAQAGIASWYGGKFHGRTTANGETYDMHGISAAHKTLPFGTVVEVTNLDNGRSLQVRINDRGPFVRGRIIDLSRGAARELEMLRAGVARVTLKLVAWPEASAGAVTAHGIEVVGPWVQVGAFKQQGRAETLVLQVREHHPAFRVFREDGWHKVQARLETKAAAADLIEQLQRSGIEAMSVRAR